MQVGGGTGKGGSRVPSDYGVQCVALVFTTLRS